jgi:hypothetical protein
MKRVGWLRTLCMNPRMPGKKRVNLDGYTIVARAVGAEVPELRATIAEATSANATAAMVLAALAIGGLTVGFFVIGRLIIGQMVVKKVHLRHLKIDQLDVEDLRVTKLMVREEQRPAGGPDNAPAKA